MNWRNFNGLGDWVEIFRAGWQIDSQGRREFFSPEALDAMVANHDPDHPPPHVITHQELYSPFRYGDAVEMKRDGDALLARSDHVEPQFEQLVRERRLVDRSVRLQPQPDGTYRVAHIAWLGAEPPAVEGMPAVQFGAPVNGERDFAVTRRTPSVLARLMRNVREWLIGEHDQDTADRVIPEWEIEALADEADSDPDDPVPQPSFSAPATPAPPNQPGGSAVTITQEQLDAAVAAARSEGEQAGRDAVASDFSARESALTAERDQARAERRLADAREFVSDQVQGNRLTPAQAEGMPEFLAQLETQLPQDAQLEFSAAGSDGNPTPQTVPTAQWFRDFVARLPAQTDLTREVGGGDAPNLGDANELAQRAQDYRAAQAAKGRQISYSQAVRAVTDGAAA